MGESTDHARGRLFLIAAPSGAGKTSLVRRLLEAEPNLCFSVSYTTRKQRSSERDGHDYHFVTRETFSQMVQAGAFLEHAQVFGNCYGTSRAEVDRLRDMGRDVLLEIDWQGARQVRQAAPDCTTIFVLPPSREELARRLRGRRTDSDAEISRRLTEAVEDISHWGEFDYVVVNDEFDEALAGLRSVIGGRGPEYRTDRPEVRRLAAELLA